jgi:hypothetical protein
MKTQYGIHLYTKGNLIIVIHKMYTLITKTTFLNIYNKQRVLIKKDGGSAVYLCILLYINYM